MSELPHGCTRESYFEQESPGSRNWWFHANDHSPCPERNGLKFAVGDRVVVTKNYRGAGCNHGAIGYYGHVTKFSRTPRDPFGLTVHVAFQGRINSPAEDYYLSFSTAEKPFPLYEFEIEHTD